jgi:plasmid stability protein
MAQVVVRNINDEAFARYKARAKAEGLTVEARLRLVVEREPPLLSREEALALMDEIRSQSLPGGPSAVELLRSLRDGDDDDHR